MIAQGWGPRRCGPLWEEGAVPHRKVVDVLKVRAAAVSLSSVQLGTRLN